MKISVSSKCLLICLLPVVIFAGLIASLSTVFIQRAFDRAARKSSVVPKHEPYNP